MLHGSTLFQDSDRPVPGASGMVDAVLGHEPGSPLHGVLGTPAMKSAAIRAVCLLVLGTTCMVAQEVAWRVEGSQLPTTRIDRGVEICRLGDIDGDGWEDFLAEGQGIQPPSTFYQNEIWITSGRDGRILSMHIPAPNYLAAMSRVVGDMDQDQVPDYAFLSYDSITPRVLGTFVEVRSGADHHLIRRLTEPGSWSGLYGWK